jgi:hypothetical protein
MSEDSDFSFLTTHEENLKTLQHFLNPNKKCIWPSCRALLGWWSTPVKNRPPMQIERDTRIMQVSYKNEPFHLFQPALKTFTEKTQQLLPRFWKHMKSILLGLKFDLEICQQTWSCLVLGTAKKCKIVDFNTDNLTFAEITLQQDEKNPQDHENTVCAPKKVIWTLTSALISFYPVRSGVATCLEPKAKYNYIHFHPKLIYSREKDLEDYGHYNLKQWAQKDSSHTTPLLPSKALESILLGPHLWPDIYTYKAFWSVFEDINPLLKPIQHKLLREAIFYRYNRLYPELEIGEDLKGWERNRIEFQPCFQELEYFPIPPFLQSSISVERLEQYLENDTIRLTWRMSTHPRIGAQSSVRRALLSGLGERQVLYNMIEEFAGIPLLPRDQLEKNNKVSKIQKNTTKNTNTPSVLGKRHPFIITIQPVTKHQKLK